MIRREPIGVVGSIAPWNYPLQMAAWKILPAIAAGNTIVLKPAEITPLTSLMFARACTDAGIPDGVVNVVLGTGRVAGEALIGHPDVVDGVVHRLDARSASGSCRSPPGRSSACTSSSAARRRSWCSTTPTSRRRCTAPSPASLINTGQDCTAATRAYVQRPLYDAFVDRVADADGRGPARDPTMDPATDQGPLVSERQRDHVAGFVDRAVTAGAKVVVGGRAPARRPGQGLVLRADAVVDAAQDSPRSCRTRSSGRCWSCCRSTPTTRGCGWPTTRRTAWPPRPGPATSSAPCAPAAEIRAGCVWVNDHIPIISEMPHGGYKQSGFGKDMSTYSFEEYTHVKHVMYDSTAVARKAWHRTIFGSR